MVSWVSLRHGAEWRKVDSRFGGVNGIDILTPGDPHAHYGKNKCFPSYYYLHKWTAKGRQKVRVLVSMVESVNESILKTEMT